MTAASKSGPFLAEVYLQSFADDWKRIKCLVSIQVKFYQFEAIDGLALYLSSETPGVNVPKKLRILWLGIASAITPTQKSSTEIRFKLPNSGNGYIGVSAIFESEKNYKAFEQQLSSLGVFTEPTTNENTHANPSKPLGIPPQPANKPKSSAKKRASTSSNPTKLKKSITAAPNNDSLSNNLSIDRNTVNNNNNDGSSVSPDSEVDTNPEILNITNLRENASSMPAQLSHGTEESIDINIDLNNPEVQTYIQQLLVNEKFNNFTDMLEQQLYS